MWKPLNIGSLTRPIPIVQGGMGVGVSMASLAGSVSREGGLGTLSSACLDRLVSQRLGKKVSTREATAIEVRDAKEIGEVVAMNVMVALESTYEASILGSLDGGVNVLVSGAGLPLRLPSIVAEHPKAQEVALVPIVSSGRALRLICLRWKKAGRLPDAVILEGPMAGGHLGWKTAEEIFDPANALEKLLPDVLEVANEFGNFPVIVAGGIYTNEDIDKILALGASGVQMGTRFLATHESNATEVYKQAVVNCLSDDILVSMMSPCGLPFRTIVQSPMHQQLVAGHYEIVCDKGYVLHDGRCLALESPGKYYCICNGLLSSGRFSEEGKIQPELFTVGANGSMVKQILSVKELMERLAGAIPDE